MRPTPKSFDSLTLVGTMSYEKGTFAFFDGTSSEYKKALKLTDAIAGYKVTNIAPNGVKLASGTNELELSVGAQLRREEDGPWLLASQSSVLCGHARFNLNERRSRPPLAQIPPLAARRAT